MDIKTVNLDVVRVARAMDPQVEILTKGDRIRINSDHIRALRDAISRIAGELKNRYGDHQRPGDSILLEIDTVSRDADGCFSVVLKTVHE